MKQAITHIALVVRDYDEAIAFYCGVLGFDLLEDSYQPSNRTSAGSWFVPRAGRVHALC
jgi:catechol 2,3-dioxygenase-like lactoylglutathione lyase family enzyme